MLVITHLLISSQGWRREKVKRTRTFYWRLSAIFLSATIASSASATSLSKDQISHEIIDKPLTTTRMGMTVRILYRRDGSVRIEAPFMSGLGAWSYSETGICMVMEKGPRLGENCITFEHLGGREYRNSEGMTLTVED